MVTPRKLWRQEDVFENEIVSGYGQVDGRLLHSYLLLQREWLRVFFTLGHNVFMRCIAHV